eukprot:110610-Chlamydomonas_euryale.AAC.1
MTSCLAPAHKAKRRRSLLVWVHRHHCTDQLLELRRVLHAAGRVAHWLIAVNSGAQKEEGGVKVWPGQEQAHSCRGSEHDDQGSRLCGKKDEVECRLAAVKAPHGRKTGGEGCRM